MGWFVVAIQEGPEGSEHVCDTLQSYFVNDEGKGEMRLQTRMGDQLMSAGLFITMTNGDQDVGSTGVSWTFQHHD